MSRIKPDVRLVKDGLHPKLYFLEWKDGTRSTYSYNKTRANYYLRSGELQDLAAGDEKYFPISNLNV